MRVLGLDTATWSASVGVVDGDRLLAERSVRAGTSHAVTLLGICADALRAAGMALTDLDLLAVSIGPGSFTGLRIGLSTAKGLALATGVAVVGVPTLEALAHAAGSRSVPVCAALDARKGEVYMAAFHADGGPLEPLVPAAVVSLDEFLRRLPAPSVLVGDAIEAYGSRLAPRLPRGVDALPWATVGPSGAVVARLGARRRAGGGAALAALEPAYIRPSEAELTAPGAGRARAATTEERAKLTG